MPCPCQQAPLRAPPPLGIVGDEPSTGSLVVATLGWLLVGGVIGAAFWVTGEEIGLIFKGKQ